jgi:hypothetical protein
MQGRSGGHGRNSERSVSNVTDRCAVSREWLGEVVPYLPPAFGALLGLRWAKDQTHRQKAVSFAFGVGVSVYFAPAIAEVLGHMPDKSPRIFAVISILTAMLGMDILAGVVAMGKAFANSPLSTFKDWWAAWKGR